MNEHIKQALIKSELMEAIGTNAYEEDGWEPIVSKFAELIVNECINVGYIAWLNDPDKVPVFPAAQITRHFRG
mgnify:CR=1 FL=1